MSVSTAVRTLSVLMLAAGAYSQGLDLALQVTDINVILPSVRTAIQSWSICLYSSYR